MYELTRFRMDIEVDKNECKGLVYRARVSEWYWPTIGKTTRLNLLKRDSCPGCEKCGAMYECLQELNEDWPIVGLDNVENGKKYTIRFCNEQRDWESGIVDDFDIELIEVV